MISVENSIDRTFVKVYSEYAFIGLTLSEVQSLVLSKIALDNVTEEVVARILDDYIRFMLQDIDNAFIIVNSYIYSRIRDNDRNKFEKIIAFFEKYKFMPTEDFVKRLLIDNEVFNRIMKLRKRNSLTKFLGSGNEIAELIIRTFQDQEEIFYDVNGLNVYIREVGKKGLLSKQETYDYGMKAYNGDEEARKILIEKNLCLVVHIALRFANRGISFDDLIQVGNLALTKAAYKYNPDKGNFSTYAGKCIECAMLSAISDHSRMFKLYDRIIIKLKDYREEIKRLKCTLGYDPSFDDIIIYTKFKDRDEIWKFYCLLQRTTSLDSTYEIDGDICELGDLIVSDDSTPEEMVLSISGSNLNEILDNCLTPNEKEVFINCNDLGSGIFQNLSEFAAERGLSRQTVTATNKRARKKILAHLIDNGYVDSSFAKKNIKAMNSKYPM